MIKKFLPWIITFVAVLVILMFNLKISDQKVEIESLNKQINDTHEKLKKYSELHKVFGIASETFYADKPVLFLKSGGASGIISIYSREKKEVLIFAEPSLEGIGYLSSLQSLEDLIVANNLENTIHVESSKGSSHLNWDDYVVTPSNKPGYYTIKFSTKSLQNFLIGPDLENFEVLVVVK